MGILNPFCLQGISTITTCLLKPFIGDGWPSLIGATKPQAPSLEVWTTLLCSQSPHISSSWPSSSSHWFLSARSLSLLPFFLLPKKKALCMVFVSICKVREMKFFLFPVWPYCKKIFLNQSCFLISLYKKKKNKETKTVGYRLCILRVVTQSPLSSHERQAA